eukprot:XP_017447643.1 PREDICTED: uncharacterized protein LOC108350385 isoform X2 [Rattus norvegicus]
MHVKLGNTATKWKTDVLTNVPFQNEGSCFSTRRSRDECWKTTSHSHESVFLVCRGGNQLVTQLFHVSFTVHPMFLSKFLLSGLKSLLCCLSEATRHCLGYWFQASLPTSESDTALILDFSGSRKESVGF